MQVTVAFLIYRGPKWLDFVLESLMSCRNEAQFQVLMVGNDATDEVVRACRGKLFRFIDHRNPDPNADRMERIYAAWNRAVEESSTDHVCLVNSDMFFADGWLDALVAEKKANPKTLPTSLLVESGRLASAFPEFVKDFGRHPDGFDWEGFETHAEELREKHAGQTRDGGLYMPVLFSKREWDSAGRYPPGNILQPNGRQLSGDRDFFHRLSAVCGLRHVTRMDSVVYHVQLGEQSQA